MPLISRLTDSVLSDHKVATIMQEPISIRIGSNVLKLNKDDIISTIKQVILLPFKLSDNIAQRWRELMFYMLISNIIIPFRYLNTNYSNRLVLRVKANLSAGYQPRWAPNSWSEGHLLPPPPPPPTEMYEIALSNSST